MAGGVLQLLAYGAEDIYLTGEPQITFFKTVYRRYTNFSIETIEREFLDNPNFGTSSKTKIFTLGDLVTQVVLKVIVQSVTPNEGARFGWVRRLGHAMINNIIIEIGGQVVDRQYGEWIDIWWELARTGDKERGYYIMIGDVPEMTNYDINTKPQYELYVPLKFWFNRFQGLALPLIGIQYHEIFLTITYNDRMKLGVTSANFDNYKDMNILHASLLINYVHLDDDERRRFANVGHEYLIEQVQSLVDVSVPTNNERYRLYFNFPTKELMWVMKNGNYTSNKKFLCYSNIDANWPSEIQKCSLALLRESMLLLDGPTYERDQYGNIVVDQYGNRVVADPGQQPPPPVKFWEQFIQPSQNATKNGLIKVFVLSTTKALWINTSSLIIGTYSITAKISATVTVTVDNQIIITKFSSAITSRDVSIPIDMYLDTRISNATDVCVNQFNNYGLLITGEGNPVQSAVLNYNDQERFVKRNGIFFNYLQPEMHHNNTPADGVNVYSFSFYPEKHQPSGTSNMSRIDKIILMVTFGDSTQTEGLPPLGFINMDSRFYIFALNYNIFKVMNGLTAVAYTS